VAAPFEKPAGGLAFALLAPYSLRPMGHLRCASSAFPNASVVSAQASGAKRRFSGIFFVLTKKMTVHADTSWWVAYKNSSEPAPTAGRHLFITQDNINQDKESEPQSQAHTRIHTGTALINNPHLKTPAKRCRAAFRTSKRNPLHAESHTFTSTIVEVKVCDWTSGRRQFFCPWTLRSIPSMRSNIPIFSRMLE
jgi:hypothetical protein